MKHISNHSIPLKTSVKCFATYSSGYNRRNPSKPRKLCKNPSATNSWSLAEVAELERLAILLLTGATALRSGQIRTVLANTWLKSKRISVLHTPA